MADLTRHITFLSRRYSCNSDNVTHPAMRRCASKFHSEDRSRNKRRAHARPCCILRDQWRRVRTRDSGSKRGELCVWADICANTDRVVDDMRKCCSDCTGYCNAAVQFIHARQNISCKSARRSSVDYAQKTLYRLKSSGYQKLVRYTVNSVPFL